MAGAKAGRTDKGGGEMSRNEVIGSRLNGTIIEFGGGFMIIAEVME